MALGGYPWIHMTKWFDKNFVPWPCLVAGLGLHGCYLNAMVESSWRHPCVFLTGKIMWITEYLGGLKYKKSS